MLETNLRKALERDEFVLQYQPKIDLRTGQITGVEALLRWDQPDLGMLQPNQFIPLAEETGLIVPIGRWVLKTACEQHMAWRRDGLPPICVAINLSPRQFQHEQLLRDIDDTLATTGMSPELLELEITEGMLMQNVERAIGLLTEIKRRGVRLSMDDFGTGYSSMALIKRFPIDTLKIDRSFIRDLPENTDDEAIADAIIRLGKALRLTIVAEGVETTEQEAFLRDHACDEMQGYLFSRPVSAESIPALLRLPTVVSPNLQPRGSNASLRMKSLT
jgi:EAL domain-containing protein (putative c-di-GMP-specific phosphodiesterase class I)